MGYKGNSIGKRFFVAIHGIFEAVRRENSLRLQALATLFVIVFCVWTRPPFIWCAIFFTLCGLVISLELVNSAVEAILDKIHPDHHSEIGFAKDCLAGAVFIASFVSVVVFAIYCIGLMKAP